MRKIVTVWAAYANAKGGRPIGKSFSYSSSSRRHRPVGFAPSASPRRLDFRCRPFFRNSGGYVGQAVLERFGESMWRSTLRTGLRKAFCPEGTK